MLLKQVSRVAALCMTVVMLVVAFTGCSAARPFPTEKEDLAVVGTVGEFEVPYEELRFLVLLYREQLKNTYGDKIWDNPETAEKYLPELKELVYENIVVNYAVLTLAAEDGVTLDQYDDEVQKYLETLFEEQGYDRETYTEVLKASGSTDHYFRFMLGVDKVYEALQYRYLDDGRLYSEKEDVKRYIKENFVYVASISLVNQTEEQYESNREKAETFRAAVVNGADIEDYFSYTIDLDPKHCFMRGEMDEAFEEAAFALENVGDVSEVFLGTADSDSAWYFMERLELTDRYIEDHYDELFDQYVSASMNNRKIEVQESLVFVMNDYGKSIDLLSIEPIDEIYDDTWVYVVIGIVVGIAVIAGAVVLFCVMNRKPASMKKSSKNASGKKR